MSEMVQRVAKALFEHDQQDARDWAEHLHVYEGQARAAIAAMREPPSSAVRDGMIAVETRRPERGSNRDQAEACWKAMIDAALADGAVTEPTDTVDSTEQ